MPERALNTISGEIEIAGQIFQPGQLLVLRPGDQITIRAANAARLMLFGGEPMEGPRWIWWNFVSSRRERIEQAQEEWRRGRFDTFPGDEAEFIPLPDTNTKPRTRRCLLSLIHQARRCSSHVECNHRCIPFCTGRGWSA